MTKEVPRTSVLRDEELIADLRAHADDGYPHLSIAAADRIEQLVATNEALSISNATLIAERDQWIAHAKNAIWSDSEQLRLAEAKLAENEVRLRKAVEALVEISEYDTGATAGLAYTAKHHLAEIKSGIATTPYGLEGESHE